MVYLIEAKLLENKSVIFGLTAIYGLGKKQADLICKKLGFAKNLKIQDLSKEQLTNLLKNLQPLESVLASNLKKLQMFNNKTLISIKSYKGLRKLQGFPIRGQRTHTNARTARKNKTL